MGNPLGDQALTLHTRNRGGTICPLLCEICFQIYVGLCLRIRAGVLLGAGSPWLSPQWSPFSGVSYVDPIPVHLLGLDPPGMGLTAITVAGCSYVMTLLAPLGTWLSGSTFKLVHHVTASSTCDAFSVHGLGFYI